MTYAAEPYAQFVDDLLTALTGGAIREEFRFLPEQEPFQLAAPGPVIPKTVRVHGLVDGSYTRFRSGTDFEFKAGAILWQAADPAAPARSPVSPDPGSTFYVSYEYQGAVPALTDRNPGSITRLLAESFAREYAVLSRQLEGVYEAGFIETAGGRDLDQLAALVGVARRRRLSATGTVVFSRSSPAPADVFIPAGTRLATAAPPAAVFETTEDRTLQRGGLSVDAPVQATVPGASGVAEANTITVMNRPILGIDTVTNPQPTRFAGADESDEQLRARCRRALEISGKATTGSLIGALTTLPGLSEKDIRIAEDYLAHPGVVNLSIAFPEMTDGELEKMRVRAVELIDATRPVGVRIEHQIDVPRPLAAATAQGNGVVAEDTSGGDAVTTGTSKAPFMLVDVEAQLTPATLSLSADERAQMARRGEDVIAAFIGEAGIGGVLVYNRLVAQLMALDGVLDVAVSILPEGAAPGTSGRKNVMPTDPTVKPVKGKVSVQIGGALIMLRVILKARLKGGVTAADVRQHAETKLRTFFSTTTTGTLNTALLRSQLGSDTYEAVEVHYYAEYVDAGVRMHQQDVPLRLTSLERLWLGSVTVDGASP